MWAEAEDAHATVSQPASSLPGLHLHIPMGLDTGGDGAPQALLRSSLSYEL